MEKMRMVQGWTPAEWPGNSAMNPGCECHVAKFGADYRSYTYTVYIHRRPEGWEEVGPDAWRPTGFKDEWDYSIVGVMSGVCERATTLEEAQRYIELRAARGLLHSGKKLYRE